MSFKDRAKAREESRLTREQETAAQAALEIAHDAHESGDGWFEAEIDFRGTGSLNPYGNTGSDVNAASAGGFNPIASENRPAHGRLDALSRIEAEGWRLHTAQYVHVQLGEESRDKAFSSGQRTAIRGKITGIYLFQRA
ncbi:hypothetical protein ACFYWS_25995 [Streptomyces sp. NPDC002795]|uniref:hypothetical protein n=1 Tax=Streptomyces sp. NPDC002795 TaxID=3364665 RepID=UPI00367E5A8E